MQGEAVFIRGSVTNKDPPNAHQAQRRPVQATEEEEDEVVVVEGGGGLYS